MNIICQNIENKKTTISNQNLFKNELKNKANEFQSNLSIKDKFKYWDKTIF